MNHFGQRTGVNNSGSAFASTRNITWGYNSKGEVVKADSSITGQDRAYLFDGIGNRLKNANSLTLPTANNYTPNALNQYTTINALNPLYDADGNMTRGILPTNTSANSTLVWDGENRLIQAQVSAGGTVNFLYDSQSRRIAEKIGTTTKITIYDGWNPIAEYNTTYALTKTYTWGIDLSGTMQGAGGVGGLLAVTDSSGTHYPTFDGNGNVSEYLTSTGAVVAHYEYDPFGRTTVATGTKAQAFAHRFSTKPLDVTSGLYYYGYRFYDPITGRWPSRDPIEERGGVNLYGFVGNNGVNGWDFLGLVRTEITIFSGTARTVSLGQSTRGIPDRVTQEWNPNHKIHAFLDGESTETDSAGYIYFTGIPQGDVDVAIRVRSRWDGSHSEWQDVNSDTEPRPSPTRWKKPGVSVTSPSDPVLGAKGADGRCVECIPYIVGVNTITTHDQLGDLPDFLAAAAIFAPENIEAPVAVIAALTGFANKNQFVTKQQIGVVLIICADGKRHASAYGYPTKNINTGVGHNPIRTTKGSWIHSSPGGNTGVLNEAIFAAWD